MEPGDTTFIDDPEVNINDELFVNNNDTSFAVALPLKLAVDVTVNAPLII